MIEGNMSVFREKPKYGAVHIDMLSPAQYNTFVILMKKCETGQPLSLTPEEVNLARNISATLGPPV